MLYRLDYADGEPVAGFLCRHMSTARRRAVELASVRRSNIVVSRIDNSGRVRPCLVIRPDGGAEPPAAAKSAGCKAAPGAPACFCPNCRAARRR